jgi:2-iminobutanoate/2-iminopropanoate deaminase
MKISIILLILAPVFKKQIQKFTWRNRLRYLHLLNFLIPFQVQVGDILFLSGEIGDAGEGTGVVPGGIVPETHRMFERIQATLAQHGLSLDDVFKCTVMLADMSEWQKFNEIYSGYFEDGKYPTRSAMGVNGLALGARVEMECWAYKPQ